MHPQTEAHDVPDVSPIDYYRIVRSRIEHENNLINQRLSWLVASQAFLFTANAIVLNAARAPLTTSFSDSTHMLTLLIPVVAICSSVLIYASVIAGTLALRDLRTLFTMHVAPQDIRHLPPLQGRALTRILGLAAPLLLPLVFTAIWGLLLARAP